MGIPIFGILYFIVEDIFVVVFGEEWRIAGSYANILIPLFFVKFVVSPLTVMNQIYLKNRLVLKWQSGLLFLYLISFFISKYYNLDFNYFLNLLSFIIAIYYIYYYFLILKYIKEKI